MSDLVIMIDLDGTLKTEHDLHGPYEVDSIHVTSGSKKYIFGARPHIHDFLSEAKKKANLYLGTAGGGGYARRVLKAMEIGDYFTEIIAAENFRDGLPCFGTFRNAIYIDNDEKIAKQKIDRIQHSMYFRNRIPYPGRQDMWVIDTYTGEKDDKTMLDLAEEMRQI